VTIGDVRGCGAVERFGGVGRGGRGRRDARRRGATSSGSAEIRKPGRGLLSIGFGSLGFAPLASGAATRPPWRRHRRASTPRGIPAERARRDSCRTVVRVAPAIDHERRNLFGHAPLHAAALPASPERGDESHLHLLPRLRRQADRDRGPRTGRDVDHWHGVADPDARLAEFLQIRHRLIAAAANALFGAVETSRRQRRQRRRAQPRRRRARQARLSDREPGSQGRTSSRSIIPTTLESEVDISRAAPAHCAAHSFREVVRESARSARRGFW
jgi:hypothetical protein